MIPNSKLDLPQYKIEFLGQFPHRYKVIKLDSLANRPLLERLRADGFFDLHVTNNGYIVGEHQVIAFYHCGGVHAVKRGYTLAKGEWSVHHINSDTLNNSPKNLRYLPDWAHAQITKQQRRVHIYLKQNFSTDIQLVGEGDLFDRNGRPVRDPYKWIGKIMLVTMVETYKHCMRKGIAKQQLAGTKLAPAKQIWSWIKKIRKWLKVGVDTSYLPSEWLVSVIEEGGARAGTLQLQC